MATHAGKFAKYMCPGRGIAVAALSLLPSIDMTDPLYIIWYSKLPNGFSTGVELRQLIFGRIIVVELCPLSTFVHR